MSSHIKALEAAAKAIAGKLDQALGFADGTAWAMPHADGLNPIDSFIHDAETAISAYLSSIGGVVCAREPVGWFNPWNENHGYQQVGAEYEGKSGTIPLHAPIPEAGNGEDLDARMKAAGMYTVAEMMGVTPLTRWNVHAGMNSLEAFAEWLDRKVSEYLRMKGAYDLGDKDEADELYEWVLAHSAVFSTIRENFRAAQAGNGDGWLPIKLADKDADRLMLGIVRNEVLEEIHIGGYRYAINDDEVSCWWSDQCDDEIAPTHWRPLPSPPSILKEGDEG
jgi:hypothetical protein